jgi:Fe-S cluster assembly protein SufB
MNTATYTTEDLVNREYKYGFVTEIEADTVPRGLNEEIVRLISAKKNEPDFMLDWRLKAYRHWMKPKQVFRQLPMEFAVEAQKLLGVSLEGSVG